ncbi:ABC transporter substrate-binding protein [uncultured Methanomethylovorans sp.]|uniref:ABC transporter substrate-binding protein n=1 Tax=uncultured Methanomethylovorans sp. TaxID=183759 RepID=UPI002AA8B12D|nr:ABC transporter substrate-binding protein [uncultured Methanomethylovorans sp.]
MKISAFLIFCLLLISIAAASQASALEENDSEARYLLAQGILSHLHDETQANITLSDLHDAASLYPEYPRSINDSTGKTFVFYHPVQRIVILNNNAADAMTVIGADNLVVGVGDTMKENILQFPELSALPSVGKWTEPDIEAILALDPDLILSYVTWPDSAKLENHLPGSIPVVRMDFYKEDVYREEMENIGHLFNEEENMSNYLAWYDKYFELVSERIADIPEDQRVRFYAEAGSGKSFGRRAYGEETGLDDLATAAGGVNVASGYITEYADVENEWVIKQNPDVIFIWSSKGGYTTTGRDEIIALHNNFTSMPGFDTISAVKDNRVYVLSSSFAYGSSSPVALVQVASWLYPDRFSDINTTALHHEYLANFTHTTEDIWNSGTFYYPDGRE